MSRAYDPVMDHLTSSILEHVYEPAEDTYLMCDALFNQREFLLDRLVNQSNNQSIDNQSISQSNEQPTNQSINDQSISQSNKPSPIVRCLEIGCGSGMAIAYLALMLTKSINQSNNQSTSEPTNQSSKQAIKQAIKQSTNQSTNQSINQSVSVLATDINHYAAECTKRTFELNEIDGEIVVTDLVEALEDRIAGKIDVLLFNPPYVPTDPSEIAGSGIERSWAGGLRGRQVTDRVLELVPRLLSITGVFFCVLLSSNDPEEVSEIMKERGFDSFTVLQRRAGREDLRIVRFIRSAQ